MQNIYGSPRDKTKSVCSVNDDDDDYENVSDSKTVPAVPARANKGIKSTGRREDLQLKCMAKTVKFSDIREDPNANTMPRTVPTFQPPPIGLDLSSPAVNAAFRDLTDAPRSEKNHRHGRLKLILVVGLILMFLLLILMSSLMFVYFSNFSDQLSDMRQNVSLVQESARKERDILTGDQRKVNQTFVKAIDDLKIEIETIKHFLGESAGKADALRLLTGNKRFWIGLRKVYNKDWIWVDGTTPVFTNWNSGEPNNVAYREHCTEMITGGWNDLDCSNTIDYICKASPNC